MRLSTGTAGILRDQPEPAGDQQLAPGKLIRPSPSFRNLARGEEGRESRHDRGGCIATCRGAWRRQSMSGNLRKWEETSAHVIQKE